MNDYTDFRSLDKKQRERIDHGNCPDCGGMLIGGPSGGVSQNVACSSCHHEFVFTPWGFTRNDPISIARAKTVYGLTEPVEIGLWLKPEDVEFRKPNLWDQLGFTIRKAISALSVKR